MSSPPDSPSTIPRLVGRAVERVEDAALLTGRGRFVDDVGERPGTAHAAVLRSPHAHAEIVSLDAAAALSMPGVVTVLTVEDVVAWSRPFIAGVKTERIRLEGDIPSPVNVPSTVPVPHPVRPRAGTVSRRGSEAGGESARSLGGVSSRHVAPRGTKQRRASLSKTP